MKFYNETTELPNGSYIKLGSVVNVIIQLTNNIEGTNFTDTLNVHVVSNVNVIIQSMNMCTWIATACILIIFILRYDGLECAVVRGFWNFTY